MEDLEQKDHSEDAIIVSKSSDSDTDELAEDELEDVAGGIIWQPQDESKWERRW